MVGFYQAYKGSTQTPLIYHGNKMVKQVYHGSNLVYQVGFSPITYPAGTSLEQFVVPLGIEKIHVDCVASRGYGGSGIGGKGGRVECDLAVTGGQVLYLTVGAVPADKRIASYNASDIRIGGNTYADRVIVAGGGGAGTGNNPGSSASTNHGGAGGGLTGGDALGVSFQAGGFGGSQSSGGLASYRTGGGTDGWAPASNGSLGLGGNGGYYAWDFQGGAGGAGYYGGGGGSVYDINKVGISSAGGGGGSSYTNSDCSNVVHTQGHQDGAGYITISMA